MTKNDKVVTICSKLSVIETDVEAFNLQIIKNCLKILKKLISKMCLLA